MNKQPLETGAAMPANPMQVFERMDRSRRMQGNALASLGFDPEPAPSQTVLELPAVHLRRYPGSEGGPPLLLLPAPIKHAYIWDLVPETSVVRRCSEAGFDVFLVDWQNPGPGDEDLGLADYAGGLLLACVDKIAKLTGAHRVPVIGHSLGGTFAAIFASLHPQRVGALVLLAAPVGFGRDVGVFGEAIAKALQEGTLTPTGGNVPGSLLSTASFLASPDTFGWERIMDWYQSMGDPAALRTHMLVERWTYDEAPLAHALFYQVAEWLCLEDRFMGGSLCLDGADARPDQVTAPLLAVGDPRCRVVPPAAIEPFVAAVSSAETQVLWYEGDVGVGLQHVGVLVGRSAHQKLWPEILDFLREHSTAPDMPRPVARATPRRQTRG